MFLQSNQKMLCQYENLHFKLYVNLGGALGNEAEEAHERPGETCKKWQVMEQGGITTVNR